MNRSATTSHPPVLRSNVRHLNHDVFWYGVLAGSTLAFLSVYAAHLGASGFQVGLLTAAPAIVNLGFSMPAARWLHGREIFRATFLSSLWHRIAYVVLLPLPWILSHEHQVWALVALVAVMSAPGTLLAIAFNAMFAEAVPSDWRGQVVGRRNALVALSLTATSVACAALLGVLDFPVNYDIVFAIGTAGALLSTYHLGRLRPPSLPRQAGNNTGDEKPRPTLLRPDLLRGPFGPFIAAYLLFYTVQYIPIPIFPLFWVQDLRLSDSAISIGNALFYMAMTLASLRLGEWSARLGHRRLLVAGALLYGTYPLLNGLARGVALFWIAAGLGGAVWGVVNAALLNRLLERVPEDDRPAHMGLHNIALNLGILLGSLAGPALAGCLGLRSALLAGGALRVVSGIVIAFLG
jgi:predicted MFS family arabinose efflux permease